MTSTQPQTARSSDVATSLVFSVQGRVVERSSSRWPWCPEVFVAGIYPGCRIILLNSISARVISMPPCAGMYGATGSRGQRGKSTPSAVARAFLSLETTFATAVMPAASAAALLRAPCDHSSPSDMPPLEWRHLRIVLEQWRRSMHSAQQRDIEPQILIAWSVVALPAGVGRLAD